MTNKASFHSFLYICVLLTFNAKVLKMRTDLELHGALSLADFPELATARVIYSALDLMFFSNREAREK